MKTTDMAKEEIDEFQQELFPLDSATRKMMIGLIDGAAADQSRDNIDSLTKTLSDGISKYLNARFKELDTKSVGSNLMVGIRDELGSQSFKDTVGNMLKTAIANIDSNLNSTIDNLFLTLSSDENKQRLEGLVASAFTAENSDALREFINNGVQGISFKTIGDSLRHNILNSATRDSLNNLVPTQIDSLLDKASKILDQVKEGNESFFEKNIWTIVASIASLMLLGTLLWLWRKNSQTNKMNDVMMASISRMGQSEYDTLTDVIKENAIQRGIEPTLNRRLIELGLLKDKRNS